jgi:DNA-binding CsgD family transcriptional regulator
MTMLRVWPMVGRQDERALVLSMMNRTTGGSAVLAGGPGVGKTRLAAAVLDELAEQGYVVERLVGSRAASRIPLGAIGTLVARRDPAEGSGILQTMAAVQRSLHEQADGRPVVVGVDDAHCLDDASAAVIHQLVVAGIASVLLTVRTGEPGPDAVTAVWKDGLAEVVELPPLGDQDLVALLEAGLGGIVEEPTALELVRSCDGNCLFLRELVRTAIDDGSLALDQGVWRLQRPVAPGPRLVNLVEARLLDLPPETRDVLELTAVGEPVPLVMLEGLVPAEALADAARRELIDVDQDGRRSVVRLAHPLYGEVVRARLPWLGARARCRTLADALDATGLRRHDDVLRFATWRLDAALSVDGERLMAATQRAQAAGDMVAVERFVSAAVEAGSVPPRQQMAARVALAEALNNRKSFREALTVLASAEPRNDFERVELAVWQANTLFLDGRAEESEEHLEATVPTVSDPAGQAVLSISRVRSMAGRGRIADALTVIDEVLATPGGKMAEVWARAMQSPLLGMAGRFDEAERLAVEGNNENPGNMTGLRMGVEWADATLEIVAIGRGDLNEAETLTRRRYDVGLAIGHSRYRRSAAASVGWVQFLKGQVTPSLPPLIEGIDDRGELDVYGARTFAWSALIGAYAFAGDLDRATETLDRAAAEHRPVSWWDPLIRVSEALVAGRRGFVDEARGIMTSVFEETRARGSLLCLLHAASMAARMGLPDLVLTHLRPLAEAGTIDGPLPGLIVRHAEALLARDSERLAAAADDLEAGGLLLWAAETLAEAATIDQSAGRSRPALALRARATRLADCCTGADVSFLGAPASSSGLTARELEVARLAAAGLSSADIAGRLHLSVRTVDTHLGRVYLKLGVAGRAELNTVAELIAAPPG